MYLLQDCQDAAFKIKSAFRPGVVDLPDGKTEAAISAITLPEMFDFINDFDMIAEPQLHMEPSTTANIRNITLVEDISSIHVDDPLLMHEGREWSEIGSIGGGTINIKDSTDQNLNDSGISLKNNFDLFDRPALDDGFGGQLGVGIVDDEDDVFNMPMPENIHKESITLENGHKENNDNENLISNRPPSSLSEASDNSFGAPASFGPSTPDSTIGDVDPFNSIADNANLDNQLNEDRNVANNTEEDAAPNTLVLEPIDTQQLDKKRKRRKKIGMVIDEVKTLSGEEMKAQLSDTTDIVTGLDLAPPNKILMNWKKTGLSDKLFTLPERTIAAKSLTQYYSRNLITNRYETNQEDDLIDDRSYLCNDESERPVNGMLSMDHLEPIEEIDKYQRAQMDSPIQPPRTPRVSMKNMQSPAPSRLKRKKTEDKENKDVANKRPRESKYEKMNHVERSQTVGSDASNLMHDSSIPEFRDHTGDVHASYNVDHNKNLDPNFLVNDQSEEEKDDEDDDLFDYAAPMSVGPVSLELSFLFKFLLTIIFIFLFSRKKCCPMKLLTNTRKEYAPNDIIYC